MNTPIAPTQTPPTVSKGKRVRARWFTPEVPPAGVVAGVQMKFGAAEHEVVGMCTHVRGNHPTAPTKIGVFVQPDDGGPEVVVDPSTIVAVWDAE